jgi:predicted acetyltransferase
VAVSVTKIVKSEEEVLLNLWQQYIHDLSEFRTWICPIDGRYRDDRLRTYFAYEEHWAYLIRCQEDVAGFALIRKSEPGTYLLGEFFIQSKFRKLGVGSQAVALLLGDFSGHWQIPFQNENPNAAKFWRRTIAKLGFSATEKEQPVEGNPELPHDVVLNFTN